MNETADSTKKGQATDGQSSGELPDLDHTTADWRDHLDERVEAYRSRCPFGHSSKHGGFFYAMEPGVVRAILNNGETFVSSRGLTIPGTPVPNTMIPINQDPPDLYEWRRILNAHFSPNLMKSYEPQLRKEAFELFDAAMAKGSVDIVNDVAQPLTGRMTLQLIGLDPDDWVYYGRAFHDLAFGIIAPEKVAAGMKDMEERLWRDIRARIGTPDATGILKYLSEEALFNGREITLEEIWNICFILLGGGLDTTQALVGSAAVYLGQHPERQQELIDHPDRLTNAIEEFLRTTPPTQSLAREAIEDVEIAGHTIKSNTKVLCSIVGANRDPAEFPDPDHLDFERQVNRHFAFGMGQHRCLGSHLARIEIKVCLEALLDRAPGFRVADDIHKYLAKDIGFFYGYEQVKLILD